MLTLVPEFETVTLVSEF